MRNLPVQCERAHLVWDVRPLQSSDNTDVSVFLGLGTFAEMMLVNARSLVKVNTQLPFEQLTLLGCAVTTGLGAALNAAHVKPGDSVAVVGCGGVGHSIVQGVRIAGAGRIIAIDPSEFKRTQALEAGATDAIDPNEVDAIEAVKELTEGLGVDVSFESAGMPGAMLQAWRMARYGGTSVPTGIGTDKLSIEMSELVIPTRRWHPSSYCGGHPQVQIPRFLALAESGKFDLGRMVTRRAPLEQINELLAAMGGTTIRSVVTFE
jgi:S-(hydroxymethyl)glutathione dehydrogenase/alcohol dehydrogenase